MMKSTCRWVPALVACVAALGADAPQRIKIATLLQKNGTGYAPIMEMSAQWRKAGLDTVLYTDTAQGDEGDIVKRMNQDQLQAAVLSSAGLLRIERSVSCLQMMPMVFRSLDEVGYVREKLSPMFDKRFADRGYVALAWADAGWVQLFSTKPVAVPVDLKKLKLFAEQSDAGQGDLMKSLGFNAVSLTYPEIYTGFMDGMVEAIPTPPFYAAGLGIASKAKYMLELNYAPLIGGIVITRKAWDALPAASRDAVKRAAQEAAKKITAETHQQMIDAVKAMQASAKLQVHKLTTPEETEWRTMFSSAYPRIRGQLVPTDLFDEVQRLLAEFRK